MSTSSEIAAFEAVAQQDLSEVRRICEGMGRADRVKFAERMGVVRTVLDDLNADRCLHCGKRVHKVPSDRVRNRTSNADIWYHPDINSGYCAEGGTMAEPAPHSD